MGSQKRKGKTKLHSEENKWRNKMELETTWIDAWIRWDRNSKDIIDEDFFNENKETIPSPTNEFAYTYKLPAETKLNQSVISLKVHGFSEKSEQPLRIYVG